ncbi:hypothetical protein A3Q37_00333 [Streptomyces sp. PTY087I2]|nr:hypothetical protein A3Q37_00333 [Streptomyces sp. PTY087I2]
MSRNIALGRATAALVQNMDADDELEPDALAALAEALTARPAVGYAVGHARDLLPDGDLIDHALPVPAGVLPRGALLDQWADDVPVHPAGVMWRRSLLLSLGGWSALHGMEDTALLMAASASADGVLVDAPTLRYRRHAAQRSKQTSKFAGGGCRLRSSADEPPSSAHCRRGLRQRAILNHLLTMASEAPPGSPDSLGRSTRSSGPIPSAFDDAHCDLAACSLLALHGPVRALSRYALDLDFREELRAKRAIAARFRSLLTAGPLVERRHPVHHAPSRAVAGRSQGLETPYSCCSGARPSCVPPPDIPLREGARLAVILRGGA